MHYAVSVDVMSIGTIPSYQKRSVMNDKASSADRTRKFNKAIGSYDIDILQNLEAGNEQENKNFFRQKAKGINRKESVSNFDSRRRRGDE